MIIDCATDLFFAVRGRSLHEAYERQTTAIDRAQEGRQVVSESIFAIGTPLRFDIVVDD
jgi:hypothetical protein